MGNIELIIQSNLSYCVIKPIYYPYKWTECFNQDEMNTSSESPEQVILMLGLAHTLVD